MAKGASVHRAERTPHRRRRLARAARLPRRRSARSAASTPATRNDFAHVRRRDDARCVLRGRRRSCGWSGAPKRWPREVALRGDGRDELRTPLASLRLYSEMIADEQNPDAGTALRGEDRRPDRAPGTPGRERPRSHAYRARHVRAAADRGETAGRPEAWMKLRPQMEAAGCPVALRRGARPPGGGLRFRCAASHRRQPARQRREVFAQSEARKSPVAVGPENGGVSITVSDRGPGLPTTSSANRASSAAPPAASASASLPGRPHRARHGGAIRSAPRAAAAPACASSFRRLFTRLRRTTRAASLHLEQRRRNHRCSRDSFIAMATLLFARGANADQSRSRSAVCASDQGLGAGTSGSSKRSSTRHARRRTAARRACTGTPISPRPSGRAAAEGRSSRCACSAASTRS